MGRVLIVDDEEEFRLLIGIFLEAKGINFELAESAAQARNHLAHARFDLVISDLNMPGESGFDLFRFVSSQYPGVRFAIMTGCGSSRTKSEARNMGIDAYIEKPFSFVDLLQIVKNLAPRCLPKRSRVSAA
jgi:two-component system, OmpR family, phosphate regulon response regulator OmpR